MNIHPDKIGLVPSGRPRKKSARRCRVCRKPGQSICHKCDVAVNGVRNSHPSSRDADVRVRAMRAGVVAELARRADERLPLFPDGPRREERE